MEKIKKYGIKGKDGRWLETMTIMLDGISISWTSNPKLAINGKERECKAMCMLVDENHPIKIQIIETMVFGE